MENLIVVVPYRNRKEHLDIFIDKIHQHLSHTEIPSFEIYVVEQDDDKVFNKGALLNIGFLETRDNGKDNYYCFNDVDTLPKSSAADYSRPPENSIIQPYGHKHAISNFFLINPDTYQKLNGFACRYWSWGFEDSDFLLRAKVKGVNVIRDNFAERFKSDLFYELDTQTTRDFYEKMSKFTARVNEFVFYDAVFNSYDGIEDGLSTTKYELKSREKFDKYTLLKCSVHNENNNASKVERLAEFDDFVESLHK